jgi:NitT/TauT family transport system permease protein
VNEASVRVESQQAGTAQPTVISPPAAVKHRGVSRVVWQVGYVVALLALWEGAVRAFGVASYVLPAPIAVLVSLVEHHQLLLGASWLTLLEILAGFALGSLLGVVLASVIVSFEVTRYTLLPSLAAFQAVPKVAFAPLFIIWLGIGLEPRIAMATVFCLFPVVINTLAGLEKLEPEALELAQVIRASRWQTYFKLRLPHSLPFLFDGLKIAMPLAVVGAIIGEFTGGRGGLGSTMLIAAASLKTDLVFAAILVITLLAVALFELIGWVERWAIPWAPGVRERR